MIHYLIWIVNVIVFKIKFNKYKLNKIKISLNMILLNFVKYKNHIRLIKIRILIYFYNKFKKILKFRNNNNKM